MGSIDELDLKRRVRWAYELGRLQRAFLGVAPVLVVIAIAACLTPRLTSTLAFGLSTLCMGTAMLWYGRDPQRAFLPGVGAGLVPLALALCANQMHSCGADGCSSLCVPACTLGGAVAGLCVAAFGNRRKAGPWFWVSASSLALLTGAMGCTCIGYSGVIGLGIGFAGGLVPGLVRRALAAC